MVTLIERIFELDKIKINHDLHPQQFHSNDVFWDSLQTPAATEQKCSRDGFPPPVKKILVRVLLDTPSPGSPSLSLSPPLSLSCYIFAVFWFVI